MPAPEVPAAVARAQALYARGVKVARVAKVVGCSQSSVCNWARQAGLPRRPLNPLPDRAVWGRQDAHVKAAVVAACAAGEKHEAVAAAFGFCVKTVSSLARRAGVPPRPPVVYAPAPEVAQAVVEMYRAGAKVVAIRAATGCSFTRITVLARAAGLPPRPLFGGHTGRPRRAAAAGSAGCPGAISSPLSEAMNWPG